MELCEMIKVMQHFATNECINNKRKSAGGYKWQKI